MMAEHPRDASGETRRLIREELGATDQALHPAVIAGRLGLHVNTVRHHLEVLENSDEVRRHEEGDGRGRPRITYSLSTGPSLADRCEATCFISRALAAYIGATRDDPHRVGVEIGEAWGRHLVQAPPFTRADRGAAVERVIALVESIGFGGVRAVGEGQLELDVVAVEDVASTAPELVTGLFLGVVTGALDALGSPVTEVELVPNGGYRLQLAERRAVSRARRTGSPLLPLGPVSLDADAAPLFDQLRSRGTGSPRRSTTPVPVGPGGGAG